MIRYCCLAMVTFCFASVSFARPLATVKQDEALQQEAEKYSRRNSRANHSWQRVHGERNDIPDHLRVVPADNTEFDSNNKDFEKKSPKVEYDFTFDKAGTYYVWIRAKGEPGGSSLAIGLDDEVARSEPVGDFPPKFEWRSKHKDNERIKLEVGASGDHVLQFWAIGDGFRVDKFIITSAPDYKPPSDY